MELDIFVDEIKHHLESEIPKMVKEALPEGLDKIINSSSYVPKIDVAAYKDPAVYDNTIICTQVHFPATTFRLNRTISGF